MKMKTYQVELKSDVRLSISVEVEARSEEEACEKAESVAWSAVNNLDGGIAGLSIDHPIEVEVVESYTEDEEDEEE